MHTCSSFSNDLSFVHTTRWCLQPYPGAFVDLNISKFGSFPKCVKTVCSPSDWTYWLHSSISLQRKRYHQKFVLSLTQRVSVDVIGHMFNPSVRYLAEKCTVHNKLSPPMRAKYKRSIRDDHRAHIIEFLFADELVLHFEIASSTLKSVDISQENSTHRRRTFQHDCLYRSTHSSIVHSRSAPSAVR